MSRHHEYKAWDARSMNASPESSRPTRAGHKSDAQLNAEALARRGMSYSELHGESIQDRERRAAARPHDLGRLLAWFRAEWDAEFPTRIHERGIEPESQLGAPRLSGALRQRFTMIDPDPDIPKEMRAAKATDYNPAKETWSTGSAPRHPIHDALARLRETKPLIAASLEQLAYRGFDIYRHGAERGWTTYQTAVYLPAEIALLWEIWSRRQLDAGWEVA